MARIAPAIKHRYLDDDGNPLAGGKLYFYEAGTQTPRATYTDSTGNTPNSNPIILDSEGYASAIYLGNALYKVVLTDADDQVLWTEDDVDGNLTDAEDGVDGRTILNGADDPEAGDGSDGDFYLNTTSSTIFGPKASGTWPAGVSLIGPQGDAGSNGSNGTDGKTILNGTVDPTTEGVDGDFYINTSSNTIFGPKASGTWPAGVSMVGPQGAQGETGDTGATGAPGANGTAIQGVLSGTFSTDTTYTLPQTPTAAGEVLVWLGAMPQEQGVDYTLSGTTITFAGEDTTGSRLFYFMRY